MEEILTNIRNSVPQSAIYIIIALIVSIIVILFILRSMRIRQAKVELSRLEDRFNIIKGTPLSFKINKAVALGRVNETLKEKVFEAQQIYDTVNEDIRQSTRLLAEMDDLLYSKKSSQLLAKATVLDKQLVSLEEKVKNVDVVLDEVLHQESEKREQINRLKEQFRLLRQKIGIDKTKFYQGGEYIDSEISNIEKMFSLFEEWMFASEFEKASQQYDEIKESLHNLDQYVIETPSIFEKIQLRIQKQIDSITYAYAAYRNENVYIEHLGVKNNLELVSNVIRESITRLSKGIIDGVKDELDQSEMRLNQLSEQLIHEYEANTEVNKLRPALNKRCQELEATTNRIQEQYTQYHTRFSLENYQQEIDEFRIKMDEIQQQNNELNTDDKMNLPATSIVVELKKLQEQCDYYEMNTSKLKQLLQSVVNDEKRAHQQLLKLNLVMHEIEVKLARSLSTSIQEKYTDDLKRGKQLLTDTKKLIDATLVDVDQLNGKIKDSIDFIYTLYNKVSNDVAAAALVENLIVFGNRYRSSYFDLDSELTRSELYFRNGEYTKALQISVNAIEKVVPGIYDKMVKRNTNEVRSEL